MKKFIITILFFLALSNAFAQMSAEYQWLIGTWVDDVDDTWIFRNDGTLIYDGGNLYFSIGSFYQMTIFPQDNWEYDRTTVTIHKINNQRMIIQMNDDFYLLNKKN